jgi:predicted Zn-dependent protease
VDDSEKKLRAAQGYSELGMCADALTELDAIDPNLQDRPDILETRVLVLLKARRWSDALESSRRLCKLTPNANGGYIHAAYCLHELGRTEEARAVLLSGPPALTQEPTYHYNLACYESVLGNMEAAQAHLDTSISIDRKFREFARTDPDLKAIRHLL